MLPAATDDPTTVDETSELLEYFREDVRVPWKMSRCFKNMIFFKPARQGVAMEFSWVYVLARLYVMIGIELLRQSPERFVKVPSMLLLSVILARAKQSLSGPFGELRRSCPHEPLCQLLFSTSSPSESRAGQRMSPGPSIDNHLHNKAKRAVLSGSKRETRQERK